jgi:Uma2 family endonuclease
MSIVLPKPEKQTLAAALPPPYRFSIAQYHRMIESGILTANDRVELLDGWVVNKMPINPPHNSAITRINRHLVRLLPDEWLLQVQGGITLRDSEPEPDFAVVRGPEELYSRRKPGPRDVALAIEVADSTLLQNRREKGLLYAQARIPEYWIVNLVEKRLEVYTDPRAGRSPGYRQRRDYGLAESVPLVLAGREIAQIQVRDLFPR